MKTAEKITLGIGALRKAQRLNVNEDATVASLMKIMGVSENEAHAFYVSNRAIVTELGRKPKNYNPTKRTRSS